MPPILGFRSYENGKNDWDPSVATASCMSVHEQKLGSQCETSRAWSLHPVLRLWARSLSSSITPCWMLRRNICTGSSRLPIVLKFLKCRRCPEIVLKSAIVLKFYSFGQNVLIWTFVRLTLWHCIHCVLYLVNRTLISTFGLLTYILQFHLSMFIIGLQYWSASMNNISEDRKTCIFCVLCLVKPTKCPEIVLKFCKHCILKFHFLLLGAMVAASASLQMLLLCHYTILHCPVKKLTP